ncbi:hypothetical protein V6Z12_A05G054200 [Gossypium hirsutum]
MKNSYCFSNHYRMSQQKRHGRSESCWFFIL